MVECIADGNHDDAKSNITEKSPFIGRDKQINEIIEDVKSNKGTKLLLVGESGIGKSALLDEVYRTLAENEDLRNQIFVGYYSKKESLIAESEFLIYPFSIVLKSLINSAKESQQLGEKIDSTMARVKKGLLKFGKEQGIKIGVAIIEDVANKVGLKETLDVGKDILKAVGSEKTSSMLAQQYIANHRDEVRESYLEIFKAIADEFKDRRFVLIFDQFENIGKASTDFFLNFVKFLEPQEKFDIIVSFRTDDTTCNDPTVMTVYNELEQKFTEDLGAMKIPIEGMSAEDIGKWIKKVRGITLPLTPDLQRIRENSAGLPFILEEWIRTSEDLNDYGEIKRDKLCSRTIRLRKALDEQDQDKLYKMSILIQPLPYKSLASYLEMGEENIPRVRSLIDRLSENLIFDEHLRWFRHELVHRCFEDDLDDEERTSYHQIAAKFFESWIEEKKQIKQRAKLNEQNTDKTSIQVEEAEENYAIAKSCAYHLHMAGDCEKSFARNKELAKYASRIGDLDIAERCYKRAIDDAKYLGRLQDEMDSLLDMTATVYSVWGRHKEALFNYQSLLEYYDKVNDTGKLVRVLNDKCMILYRKGEYEEAMELYNQSLEIAKQIRDQEMLARALSNKAMIHDKKGEYDKAMELYNQSLEIAKQRSDQKMIAGILNDISSIHDKKGEYEEAMELYNQSLEISEQSRDLDVIVSTLNNKANVHYRKGEYDKAMELYNQSLEISEKLGYQYMVESTLNNIAAIHYVKGEYDKAMELYNQSLEIAKQIGDQEGIAHTLSNTSMIHDKKGEYEAAISAVLQAYEILDKLKSPELQRPVDILYGIKDKLGSEAFERLFEKVQSQDLS